MNLAELSIKRPTFITCVVLAILAIGYLSLKKLGVDLFPDVTFPVVTVTTPYPGAAPSEIETLVSKPLEDEISTISGIKKLRSINREGVSVVVAEFTLETDVKYAEQQVRDRVSSSKRKLPTGYKEPVIRRIDPSDQPIVILSVQADLPEGKLFDVADNDIRPKLEQVNQVGLVDIVGGRKRELRVELDRDKLKAHEISAFMVASRLASAGENIPVGKVDENKLETVFRTMGEFTSLADIRSTIVNFLGNENPVTVSDVATVTDSLEEETSRAFVNGKKSLLMYVFKQSGANTVAVVDAINKKFLQLNSQLSNLPGKPHITMIRDGAVYIRANIEDVKESIYIGIFLTILVVFYFLGNGRSTIITGLALPNSLIGAFILMAAFGFTINLMTLLALSLSVGLLIDDAIVVRENIFRHIEMGKPPLRAAVEGTGEVRLAVIATTLTVIAVFGPIGSLKGVTGQFFKQFGLTICFAMAISLFDALTIAPMLSAYFAGHSGHDKPRSTRFSLWDFTLGRSVRAFDRFQTALEESYVRLLGWTLRRRHLVLGFAVAVFIASCVSTSRVPKTFLPPQDNGEFIVGLDLPPGTNLDEMTRASEKVDALIRSNSEVAITSLTVGSRDGEVNVAEIYVQLVPAKARALNTSGVKQKLRDQLAKELSYTNPKVKDYDAVGAGMRPFNLEIISTDADQLEKMAPEIFASVRKHPGLKDVNLDYKPGKPEFRIVPDKRKAERLGISTIMLGQELRTQIEGDTPAKLREQGREYDIRVRLKEEQRNLRKDYSRTFVPNINHALVRLPDVATPLDTTGAAKITRVDRSRYILIDADITPGAGLGNIMTDLTKLLTVDMKLPPGMRFAFTGQAENFQEMAESFVIAVSLAVLFIFLILASLYESFVTPLTIMVALPLAICGSLYALFMTGQSLNIFSMIGIIMLLGVATKNSILLVDYANQRVAEGMSLNDAILASGKTRLRPILMTTMALIAGTLPVALGLNEASRQRTSMGVAIIGGLISSTLLTLVVVPAIYSDISRFKDFSRMKLKKLFGVN